mgnify:CR=1 FL=1
MYVDTINNCEAHKYIKAALNSSKLCDASYDALNYPESVHGCQPSINMYTTLFILLTVGDHKKYGYELHLLYTAS